MSDLSPEFVTSARKEGLTIVIGTGSVAATNLGGLVHELSRCRRGTPAPGRIVVILTAGAERFVAPATVRHLGRCPVLRNETVTPFFEPLHVWLTDLADQIVVYPASAGFIARAAAGMATDLASTTLLCAPGVPTLVIPAMHPRMWANHLVQQNVRRLRTAGMRVLEPRAGMPPEVADVVSASTTLRATSGPGPSGGRPPENDLQSSENDATEKART